MNLIKTLGFFLLAFGISSLAYTQSATTPQAKTPNFSAQISTQSSASPAKKKVEFAEHQVIAKFKNSSTSTANGPQTPGGAVNALSQEAVTALSSIQGTVVKSFSNIGAYMIQTPLTVGKAIETLYRSGAVQYAEPNYKVRAIATVPNDPNFSSLWGLDNIGQTGGMPDADIDAPEAWDIRTDASNVIVAVVDTGVDYNHQDLSSNLWKNPKEIPGNGIDDDGNGWIDDVYGIDTCNHDADPMDDHSHGTHVSGTIGAIGNNGIGVTGVAWKAKIMALKFLCSNGSGWTSDAIEAINYALAAKVKYNYPRVILSNSWGGGGFSAALYDTITIAKGLGVLFIAAAGNDGMNTDNTTVYPAGYNVDNIIAVGATDSSDNRAWFSNYGCGSVDVFAPGVDILSTVPGNSYASYSGTSMATPHISGMAAVIWANSIGKNWRVIKSAVMNSVDQPPSMSRLSVSQGRANLYNALQPGALDEPTIWKVSPRPANPGATITITGNNFGSTAGVVDYNGNDLAVLSWSNTAIKAKIGVETGTGILKVIKADGNVGDVGACFEVALTPSLVGRTRQERAWASGARVGSDFWIMGGETPWGITGLVEQINLNTLVSTIDSSWMMPIPLSNTGSAAIGSKIYVVGGYNYSVYNTLLIFDTVYRTWRYGSPLPESLMQAAVAAVNGKLYVFGGLNQWQLPSNTTYIYDPMTNSWSMGASKPTPTAYATATTAPGSTTVLVAGGFACSSFGCEQNGAEVYDTMYNWWMLVPSMNRLRGGAAGAYYKGKDHALFGSYYNTTGEYYDGSSWLETIGGGPPLYTGMGTVNPSGKYMFILDGLDQGFGWYSANIWRLTE